VSWGPTGRIKPTTVTVELDWDSVEFIAMELPQGDGFTRDWWSDIHNPMLALREEQENVEDPSGSAE
jgi:hypothetical protein